MRRLSTLAAFFFALLQLALAGRPATACGPYDFSPPEDSQEEVDRLMATRALILKNHQELLENPEADAADQQFILTQIEQIDAQLDKVGHQFGCATSGLFWHTDLAEAQATAASTGKPILSLRMLGNLTDEYSCANSRYFRTTLYANEEIAAKLREQFVLHWESVRPVPVVTIDFGDGRVLRRTVTGNSAHYVLTPEGEPVDLLPGLYGPAAFSAWLDEAAALAERVAATLAEARPVLLAEYHRQKLTEVEAALRGDLEAIGRLPAQNATAAAEWAEVQAFDDDTWQEIAWQHSEESRLDEASIAAIEAQHPTAFNVMFIAVSKARVETPLTRMVQNLEGSIALDTVRNEYLLHIQIHQWYATGSTPENLTTFTNRVYDELFLTPASDPWLGLAPPDAYTGLENGGLSVEGGNPEGALLMFSE